MQTRKECLLDLANYSTDITVLVGNLRHYPWDSTIPLVTLTRQHIIQLLARFMQGELNAQQVEAWANAIEGREDIGFEAGQAELLEATIFQLANPLLTQEITLNSVQQLLNDLV